ncbi:hypothetical protein BH09ACT9_BH09ACT9_00660 [soil metagenome]
MSKTAYINIELEDTPEDPAQIIICDEPREDLAELARWQEIPVSAANALLKAREKADPAQTAPPAPTEAELKSAAAEAKADAAK